MKNLILVFALLFSNNAFANTCDSSYYTEVPHLVEELVGNLYEKPADKVIEILDEAFREVIGDFAKITHLSIYVFDFDGTHVVYRVIEEDSIWSAPGGSSYFVNVDTKTGVPAIDVFSCWESGE